MIHSPDRNVKTIVRKCAATNAVVAYLFLLSANSCCLAIPKTSANSAQNLWYGIFLTDRPIGGAHMATEKSTFNGKPALLSTSDTLIAVTLLGGSVSQEVKSQDWSDIRSGVPIYEQVDMLSGGHTTTVTAAFSGRTVNATLISGGNTVRKTLTVPTGAILLADDPTMSPPTFSGKRVVYFDPATISLQDVTVSHETKSRIAGYRTIVVTTPTGVVTVEKSLDGIPNRIFMPGGLLMKRLGQSVVTAYMTPSSTEPNGLSVSPSEMAPPDLAVVSAVVPAGMRLLPHPSHLFVEVTEPGKPAEYLNINSIASPIDFIETRSSITERQELRPTLADSPYLGINSEAVRNQASAIVGTTTNLYDIAVKLKRWVSQNMTPSTAIGLPRSACDILGDRRGVCRDYALLYTALARSAGVPTRLCAGVVGYQGKFYYHAWAESYVGGKIGWMPFDPTLPVEPVDASHIPLVKGDPASYFDLAGKIGQIKINILECSS